jgi:Domain of Unknown Function with PDB structure (DUF3857)
MNFTITSLLLQNNFNTLTANFNFMKPTTRKLLILILVFIFYAPVFAQKDVKKYKEEADAMRKEVWGWDKPEFAVRTIPAEYANASRVIIARHMDISADSKKKTKFTLMGFAAYRKLTLTEITREAVKINDKSAVSDYSEITFTQIEKRSGFFIDQTTMVYIGVRVIKPNGSMKEINADDVVLTKDEKNQKEAKVAIPDLQVGDIIDYFLAKQQSMEQLSTGALPPYTFTLFDDVPVMHYSIHCEMGKKYAIEYRSYNGAPDFKRSQGEDDDNILDLVKKNIPAFAESNLWISAYRQLPIIRMNIMVGYKGMFAGRLNAREPGQVYKNQPSEEFIQDELNGLAMAKRSPSDFALGSAYEYYKKLDKNRKNLSPDSVLSELYYLYRFASFLDVDGSSNIERVINMPKIEVNESPYIYRFGRFLKADDVDNKLILITPGSGPQLKEIMSTNDIRYLLLVESGKNRIFGLPDIFCPAFYVPSYYENTRQAITVDLQGPRELNPKKFDQATINIPGSRADQNTRIEKINVIPAADGSSLQVSRQTTLKGHYKSDVQKQLVLFEDYYEAERKTFNIEQPLIEQLEDGKKTKKFAEELKAAFAEARRKHKDAFVDEAKQWFEQDITDLADYKIENLGVRHNSPDFVYSSKFKMGGVIKKAGNNFIIEVGKLQGSPLKISPDQRKRTLDIYMPFARSLQTEISLQIPDGYTIDGVDALNKKVENETGYFICEANSDGKTVTIRVKKSYNNTFEPVANWNKLLAFIDAANDWTNAKLLMKKK